MYCKYKEDIQKKSLLRKIIGIVLRFKNYIYYYFISVIFRIRGAEIGKCTSISMSTKIKEPNSFIVGQSTLINNAVLDARGGLNIGSHCIINERTEIITATHDYDSPMWETIKKSVVIEDYVWLATGCKILPGVKVGYGSVVGAGSIVTRDIPPMSICVGVPAKVVGNRKCIHDGFPTEKLNGTDFSSYLKAISCKN